MKMHMCISIRGVLNWKGKRLLKLFTNDDGTKATMDEIKEYLYNKLSEGYEVLPMSAECDNFDKKTGCRGHN